MPDAPIRLPDRRVARTRRALRDALARQIAAAGGLDRVTATAVAEDADVTRRTFYTHYRDIPDLVAQSERELLDDLAGHVGTIAATTLDELYAGFRRFEPCPGSVELLGYVRDNGALLGALLGPGGDPGFAGKVERIARDAVRDRALHGIERAALGPFFDYYLTYIVSAELGVLRRWLAGGMAEPPEVMARVMTVLMFVRPGDLYGKPLDVDLAVYGGLLAPFGASSEEIEEP